MYLYIYEGFRGGPDRKRLTEELILKAIEQFAVETGASYESMSREICRTEKGKPYFKEIPVEFSVSHTEDMWVCLIDSGEYPVGVDIQKIKDTNKEKIAARYYTDDEKACLQANGEEAFFRIWTRKEAYAKYTGKGLTRELTEFSTLDNDEVEFIDFEVRTGITGSCCVKENGVLCLRVI